LLAFVHIPRTGGGTMSSAISKNYSRLRGVGNFQIGPEKTRDAIKRLGVDSGEWKALGDHAPLGLYLRYLPADTRHMTVLRDPVDRVLSHYHFHARAGERKLKSIWSALLVRDAEERGVEPVTLDDETDFSLEAGLARRVTIYDNFMTRFLWGGETIFGELPADALDRAKENVGSFWFVGIQERLDDSIVLLGRKLGIGLMPYHLRHVNHTRPQVEETSDELRALIAEHNQLDAELYRFARERFDSESPSPEELAADGEELRQLSLAVTAAGEEHKAGKRDRKTAARAAREERETKRAAVRAERADRKSQQKSREGKSRKSRSGQKQEPASDEPT
jgi:hypothetical protein